MHGVIPYNYVRAESPCRQTIKARKRLSGPGRIGPPGGTQTDFVNQLASRVAGVSGIGRRPQYFGIEIVRGDDTV
jgi:hypothetical protein